MEKKPTKTMLSALRWLKDRNGDGFLENNRQVVIAKGEESPVKRDIWDKLENQGFVMFYPSGDRIRVTAKGNSIIHDIDKVKS